MNNTVSHEKVKNKISETPELVLFKPEHLSQINMRPFDKQNLMGMDNGDDPIKWQAENGTAFTIKAKEGIVAIGGVCLARPGVGSGWAITSDLFVKYKIFTHRAIRDIIEDGIQCYKLHRVEAAIMKKHKVSCKWAERLGFKKEGLMRQFDKNKRDYYMYARII